MLGPHETTVDCAHCLDHVRSFTWHVAAQAELVAQFLCCIPLTTVDAVLGWLKPSVPPHEQEELLQQARLLLNSDTQVSRMPTSSSDAHEFQVLAWVCRGACKGSSL